MRRHEGYTLVEVIVVVAIIGLLVSTLLPVLDQAREMARRAHCRENVRGLYRALLAYQGNLGDNDYFPAWRLNGSNYFDTKRALWTLVVHQQVEAAAVFVCPSDRYAKPWKGAVAKSNPFPIHTDDKNLKSISYSYQVPYSLTGERHDKRREVGSPRFERAGDQNLQFAIVADRAPYDSPKTGRSLLLNQTSLWSSHPKGNAERLRRLVSALAEEERRRVNSPVHKGAGQNVLYRDGHVEWRETPLAGINDDNIYTRYDTDLWDPWKRMVGRIHNKHGPRYGWDSYLRTRTY
jgi:prepilin-type N-terminal cleavage/methylation domain-containing protein